MPDNYGDEHNGKGVGMISLVKAKFVTPNKALHPTSLPPLRIVKASGELGR
jgi:hypothetical protein